MFSGHLWLTLIPDSSASTFWLAPVLAPTLLLGYQFSIECWKVISRLLCITTLCDWFTKLAPLSQPIGNENPSQNQSCFRRTRFPTLGASYVFAPNSDWFVVLFASAAIGQSNYFGFGFTTLNWKPRYYKIVRIWHEKRAQCWWLQSY